MQLPGSHVRAAIGTLGSATGDSRTTIIAKNHACSARRNPSEAHRAVNDQVGLLHVFESDPSASLESKYTFPTPRNLPSLDCSMRTFDKSGTNRVELCAIIRRLVR